MVVIIVVVVAVGKAVVVPISAVVVAEINAFYCNRIFLRNSYFYFAVST